MSTPPSYILVPPKLGGVGPKAERLVALRRLGLQVPPFFVLHGLDSKALPEDLESSVCNAAAELGIAKSDTDPISFRSCGSVEDGTHRFPGAFHTSVAVLPDMKQALTKVLESPYSPTAQSALARYGMTPGNVQMDVIVQKHITGSIGDIVSGIVLANKRKTTICALWGAGAAIADGAGGDTYIFERGSWREGRRKISMGWLWDLSAKSLVEVPLPDAPSLTQEECKNIYDLVQTSIGFEFYKPPHNWEGIDAEFVIHKPTGKKPVIYFVQAREY